MVEIQLDFSLQSARMSLSMPMLVCVVDRKPKNKTAIFIS